MPEWVDVEQGSSEWLVMRRGVVGSTCAWQLLTPAKRRTLIKELFAERASRHIEEHGNTEAMRWGNETERAARLRFDLETGLPVEIVGYAWLDGWKGAIGCSPDGLIGKDGIIEIKAPSTRVHCGYWLEQKAPAEYIAQMQFILGVTERQRAHFVSYDPRCVTPVDYLHIIYERDETMIAELLAGAKEVAANVLGHMGRIA
jgi:exodeoxyribonuclease (lambda-induced)